MPRQQAVIPGKSTSGPYEGASDRYIIAKLYEHKDGRCGWEVHIGINKHREGQADKSIRLRPDECADLIDVLKEFSAKAREAFIAAHSV